MAQFRFPGLTRWLLISVGVFAVPLLFTGSSHAQDPASAPTTEPAAAAAESLEVVIAEVRGLVRVRESTEQPWQKAAVGMKLGEGAEFQTGPKSACVCTIE